MEKSFADKIVEELYVRGGLFSQFDKDGFSRSIMRLPYPGVFTHCKYPPDNAAYSIEQTIDGDSQCATLYFDCVVNNRASYFPASDVMRPLGNLFVDKIMPMGSNNLASLIYMNERLVRILRSSDEDYSVLGMLRIGEFAMDSRVYTRKNPVLLVPGVKDYAFISEWESSHARRHREHRMLGLFTF